MTTMILVVLFLSGCAFAQTSSTDSLRYHSSFAYTQTEIDQRLENSPQVVLSLEKNRAEQRNESFFNTFSFHLTYNPVENISSDAQHLAIGFTIPFGKLLLKKSLVEEAEFNVLMGSLKIQSRELMKQREILLHQLALNIQKYRTYALRVKKEEVFLSVNSASRDEVFVTKDTLTQILTSIKQTKLEIGLIEDKLLALIGEL